MSRVWGGEDGGSMSRVTFQMCGLKGMEQLFIMYAPSRAPLLFTDLGPLTLQSTLYHGQKHFKITFLS
jgi:hypothetical protein